MTISLFDLSSVVQLASPRSPKVARRMLPTEYELVEREVARCVYILRQMIVWFINRVDN